MVIGVIKSMVLMLLNSHLGPQDFYGPKTGQYDTCRCPHGICRLGISMYDIDPTENINVYIIQ